MRDNSHLHQILEFCYFSCQLLVHCLYCPLISLYWLVELTYIRTLASKVAVKCQVMVEYYDAAVVSVTHIHSVVSVIVGKSPWK